MNDKPQHIDDTLDAALRSLPRDIEPNRDLWPGIRAVIEASPPSAIKSMRVTRAGFGLWGQLAAGVALTFLSSAVTYVITHEPQTQPTMVASATHDSDVAAEYLRARAELDRQFSERIATLPPSARAKLVGNLADVRRAADEILINLAAHPSDPLLYELLISTYRSEAQLLASVETFAPSLT